MVVVDRVVPYAGAAASDGKAHDDSAHDAFWARNPRGVPLEALFGWGRGAGEIGRRLKSHDVSGDGFLSKEEFRTAIVAELQSEKSNRSLRQLAAALAVFAVFLVGMNCALTFVVVDLSRQVDVSKGEPVLRVKGTDTPVQTASADVSVDGNNVLKPAAARGAAPAPAAAAAAARRRLAAGAGVRRRLAAASGASLADTDALATAGVERQFTGRLRELLDMPVHEIANMKTFKFEAYGGRHEYKVAGASHYAIAHPDADLGVTKRVVLLKFADQSGIFLENDYNTTTGLAISADGCNARFLPTADDVVNMQKHAQTLAELAGSPEGLAALTGDSRRRHLLWGWRWPSAPDVGRFVQNTIAVVVQVVEVIVEPLVEPIGNFIGEHFLGDPTWGEDLADDIAAKTQFLGVLGSTFVASGLGYGGLGYYEPEGTFKAPPPGRARDLMHVAWHHASSAYGGGLMQDNMPNLPVEAVTNDYYQRKICAKEDWGFGLSEDDIVDSRATSATAYVSRSTKTGDVALVFRGSLESDDWKFNFDSEKVPCAPLGNGQVDCGMVHRGWHAQYMSVRDVLKAKVKAAIAASIAEFGADADWSLLITGHSLGGALTHVAQLDYATDPDFAEHRDRLVIISWAGPAVGDETFANAVRGRIPEERRFIVVAYTLAPENAVGFPARDGEVAIFPEIVPYVAPKAMGFHHTGRQWNVPCLFPSPGDDDKPPTTIPGVLCHGLQYYWNGLMQFEEMRGAGGRYSDSDCTCKMFTDSFRLEREARDGRNWKSDERIPDGCPKPGEYYPFATTTMYNGGEIGALDLLTQSTLLSIDTRYEAILMANTGNLGIYKYEDDGEGEFIWVMPEECVGRGWHKKVTVNTDGQLILVCNGATVYKSELVEACRGTVSRLTMETTGELVLRCGGGVMGEGGVVSWRSSEHANIANVA